ncbi:MAG TPA: phosphatase PAP2 family protein [Acidimicrobiia bacterium]|nr:phosphatase PAP2 family protein [Acidimicrobiia bacterium]
MTTIDSQLMGAEYEVRLSRLPLRGAAQIAVVFWIYALYGAFRNLATGPAAVARNNAEAVLAAERVLHLGFERSLQHLALHWSWVVTLCSTVYSGTHLVVPLLVLVLLYRRTPARYAVWRDTFLVLLGLALVAFAVFPLMPPRLMPSSYHFADTSHVFTISRGPLRDALGGKADPTQLDVWQFSNPYAAMPSLHATWALWACLAAWPVVHRRWVKALLVAYPPAMAVSVVVTANHWVLDVVVGGAMLAAAYGVARAIDELRARRLGWLRPRPQVAVGEVRSV